MGDSRDSLLNHFKSSHLNTKTAKDGQTLTAEEIKRYTKCTFQRISHRDFYKRRLATGDDYFLVTFEHF